MTGPAGVKPMELTAGPVLNLFHRFASAAKGRGPASEVAAAVAAWAGSAGPAFR